MTDLIDRLLLRQLDRLPANVAMHHGFEQVVGEYRPAPHKPRFRTVRHDRQPSLAARVHRNEFRAGTDDRSHGLDTR